MRIKFRILKKIRENSGEKRREKSIYLNKRTIDIIYRKKKLGSFFDFHTKSRKNENREMQLVALILGFGG